MSPSLFSGLRLRLTLLYLAAGMVLVVIVVGTAYGLLRYYFESRTDLALRHVLASQIQLVNAPVPPDLAAADNAWLGSHRDSHPGGGPPGHPTGDEFDGDLATVYTLRLNSSGAIVESSPTPTAPFPSDPAAVDGARATGYDARTATLNGASVRLLTYRVDQPGGPSFLQIGRPIADQEGILGQMLSGLLGLGGGSTVVLAALSWWLAGRSLRPAQVAWERQQAFVASASHELRAPLTLIRATADVALRELPAETGGQKDLWDDVLRDCDHLARLVDDLLLLSRLDAGRLHLTPTPVPLSALLTELERGVGRVAAERGVRLVVESDNGAATADPARLRQVLLIFLDNALRHTPRGGEVRLSGSQRNGKAHLVVADTGEGIAPEHLPRIFERFYVADKSRATSGSGLGLSIARALVDLQGGEITLTSRPGQGTRVDVELPALS